jgi:threonylcarbamoyladenosine tRNA methylthiotransferase MtaB
METVSVVTVGCKLNQYETQLLSENLRLNGYRVLPWGDPVDVVVVNTCSVTSRAEATARNFIHRTSRFKPQPYLAVTGCYARRKKNELAQIEGVRLVGNLDEVIDALAGGPDRTDSISSFDGHTRAFVKIQDGCDNHCTFCVLPRLRGRPRSRPAQQILEEVSTLCGNGYSEVVLTGINMGNYRDVDSDFVALLDRLERIQPLRRLRLSSIEPTHIDERFLQHFADSEKLCAHLHIPLQSGDEAILRRMGRRYTPDDYLSVVKRLKEANRITAVGADVIVGFPGETEREFENTRSLVQSLPISYLHVFRYSPREETAARAFDGKVPEEVKKERGERLMTLGHQKWLQYRKQFLSKELEVLVEHRRDVRSGKLMGLSSNYIRVLFCGDDSLMGTYARVLLQDLSGKHCNGGVVAT